MQASPLNLALLILAAATLGACSSSERAHIDTPRWIKQNPNLQFDFTVPIYNDPLFLGIKVNVSFDGLAQFYLLRSDQPYTRIKATNLTFEEMAHLASLFEEAHFTAYPKIVPTIGRVGTPPSVVQLSYRRQRGRPHHAVWGAVSKKRNKDAYPEGFFELIDDLAHFVSHQLSASDSDSHAALPPAQGRRVATIHP